MLTLVLCVLTGFIYPGAVTGVAQLLFPAQANGSLVTVNGRVVGSALIGQSFTRPEYFHPRPSAAGAGYDAAASSGTNKGPTDRKLADTLIGLRVDSAVAELRVAKGRRAVGSRDGQCVRTRPAYLAGECAAPGGPRGACARRRFGRCAPHRGCAHRRSPVRRPWRTPRERAAAQHRNRLGFPEGARERDAGAIQITHRLRILRHMRNRPLIAVAATLSLAAVEPFDVLDAQTAPTDTTPRITFGAFVDGYFAWDAGRPPSFDRSFAGGALFTTQPARHNEFNVNLAFIEARLDAPHYRGRFALQAGTSVQSNYSGEANNGMVSGPALARMIQEAVVGVKVADNVWVDGGVFYSHLGMETWVSRDNLTYSRSLVSDYSPYYQSGAKVTWTPTTKLTAQLDVVNGCRTSPRTTPARAQACDSTTQQSANRTLSYYNLVSSEAGSKLRVFNGVGAKQTLGKLTLLGELDLGSQSRGSDVDGSSSWFGWTAIARVQTTPRVSLVFRAEGYTDDDQVIIATGTHPDGASSTPNPAFHGIGGSAGLDVSPYARVLWRTEVRGWQNKDALFPDGKTEAPIRSNAFIVTSLSLSF
jgi:hypothetical protein